jgi:hypothetical protein
VVEHDHKITELVLSSGARVNEFEKRAGYANARDFYSIADPEVAPEFIVPQSDVIDLTQKMQPDGTLDWTPPRGLWRVLRIGSSLTGHENGPAPAEATGLEVDKLNRGYVKNYVDGYLKMYARRTGPIVCSKSSSNGAATMRARGSRRSPASSSKAPRTPTVSSGTSGAPSGS